MADTITRRHPVDSGWAWVVLFGCTCNFALIVGTIKSFGIFFIEFLVIFDASVSMTSMIAGLMQATYSFVSLPIMAIGLRHISPRQSVICGAFIGALAYALGSLAPNVNFLLFTHGILFGIAFGCIHGPSTYVVGQYFEKRRSLANACMTAGGSVGGLVLPSVIQILLETYGLRGALLLMSAMILHASIGAMLMRPPAYFMGASTQNVHAIKESVVENDGSVTNGKLKVDLINNDSCRVCLGKTSCSVNCKHSSQCPNSSQCPKNISASSQESFGYVSLDKSKLSDSDNEIGHQEGMYETSQNSYGKLFNSKNDKMNSNASYYDKRTGTNSNSMATREYTERTDSDPNFKEYHICSEDTEVVPLESELKETLKTSHVMRTDSQCTSFSSHGDLFTASLTDIFQLHASAEFSGHETTEDVNGKDRDRRSCLSVIYIDLSLLRNPVMVIFLFVYCLGSIGSAYGQIYITALAHDVGISTGRITLLVSTMSGCDVIGRLICGAVVDRGWMTSFRATCLTILITGVMMQFAHLFQEFWSMLIYSILHGLFAGGIFALTPAILVDLLGFEKFRSAMGIAIFAQGFSLAASAPFIGFLRDRTHAYNSSFQFMGSCMILSGMTLFLKPIIIRLMCRQRNTDGTSSSQT